jgi:hypothetical protein
MPWKEAAAQLGTSTLVSGLKALEGKMKKRDFKRLVSTTVAQLLEVHPGLGRRKARRWARKATGTRPGKLGLGKKGNVVLTEAAEEAGAPVVAVGKAKAASKLSERRSTRRRARVSRTNGKPKEVQPEVDADQSSTTSE